ncbi:AtpZ/AtpI family protein [Paenalkalicoccus suaedae]|uniref:AtpZ/AtpI family protein n=1 Tax=Paenalkalicoccus suaedae TaxID=2592382 RepID=A0A859FJC5_9BACI|nr:AtpZ/AtpI family protein [Paenalkalicoccus suaedae]QKS72755.1 AtpZ/AtpI family protein [Paenalkalicoccus suaedae]
MAQQPRNRKAMKAFALMSTISAYTIGGVLLGVIVGLWLDSRYDGSGLFLVLGFLIGLVVTSYGIYKTVQQFLEDDST